MIKLRSRNSNNKMPEMQISPMIDMIFLLLVFFIVSTMYMTELKTIPVKMPTAQNSVTQNRTNFVVAVKEDGSVWLGDKQTDLNALEIQAGIELKANPELSAIIRADKKAEYGLVIGVLDRLKGVGVTRFGMATEIGSAR